MDLLQIMQNQSAFILPVIGEFVRVARTSFFKGTCRLHSK